MSRDEQFAGFAKSLLSEMVELHGYIDISGFWNSPDDEDLQEYTQVIARRAYDLVCHVVAEVTDETKGYLVMIEKIPDMRQWPEEASR